VAVPVHYLRGLLVLAIAVTTLPAGAPAAPCPGDLNGDGTVAIDEIMQAVTAALTGCGADPCPGDLNGDHVVTIDEIIKAVSAALQGCDDTPAPTPAPSNTPTPTPSVIPTPTGTATVTPTPTVGHCPYTFLDDTLALGTACGYSGAFSANPTCSADLSALVLSDPTNGNLVAASIGSDPIITFGGIASSPTQATLVAYFVGSDPTPQPLSGVLQLSDDGTTLVIEPDPVPSFMIGGIDCSFDRYAGTFTRLVSEQARRLTARRTQIGALHAVRESRRRLR
jgi:hypothetical protein